MKRLAWMFLAGGILAAAAGCGDDKTTAHCDAACDIWAGCGWDRAACMSQCQADGDWDQAYLDCLQRETCETFDSACP